ncbi:hypothetical protein B1A99_24825 [Cohnella sp. CIP 111063]|uniref:hypothetical protein n=1 Tax=unclassified Cohnella TaxID=2636738 RepID=UPI000B8BDA55|nr:MULTISPECIES: hypothetical protein [unclassified Cohnella]OXS55007.1 hypothetical protein B1A99_24825 [Cohnella sp. CIP 111063]PRX65141.1 hypothetical protein B0G52_11892 [Cohnella sp. SGD-V74]
MSIFIPTDVTFTNVINGLCDCKDDKVLDLLGTRSLSELLGLFNGYKYEIIDCYNRVYGQSIAFYRIRFKRERYEDSTAQLLTSLQFIHYQLTETVPCDEDLSLIESLIWRLKYILIEQFPEYRVALSDIHEGSFPAIISSICSSAYWEFSGIYWDDCSQYMIKDFESIRKRMNQIRDTRGMRLIDEPSYVRPETDLNRFELLKVITAIVEEFSMQPPLPKKEWMFIQSLLIRPQNWILDMIPEYHAAEFK